MWSSQPHPGEPASGTGFRGYRLQGRVPNLPSDDVVCVVMQRVIVFRSHLSGQTEALKLQALQLQALKLKALKLQALMLSFCTAQAATPFKESTPSFALSV